MAETIDKVPAEARWQMATKGLTGAVAAYSNTIRETIGDDKYLEFSSGVWGKAGEGAKQFAESFGFSAKNAPELAGVTEAFARSILGPEFKTENVESSKNKAVVKLTMCPWHERAKEMNTTPLCEAGHLKWGESALKSLNPDFTYSITKSIARGDSYCEMVIERK